MARATEETKEAWRGLLVLVLLDLRAAYLADGGNVLRHWDQLLDRMRAAARTSSSMEEWHTSMCRSLQLGAPSSAASSTLSELVATVGIYRSEALDLVEREHGYLMAKARLEAERRKDARDELAASKVSTITLEGES